MTVAACACGIKPQKQELRSAAAQMLTFPEVRETQFHNMVNPL
jgi:hypothetical protein